VCIMCISCDVSLNVMPEMLHEVTVEYNVHVLILNATIIDF
jgi:hypothetical protein